MRKLQSYCSGCLLLLNRDRVLNALSKVDPSNDSNNAYIQLIKSLSLPINRLDRYASLLNEYLYNLEVKFNFFQTKHTCVIEGISY